MWFFFYLDKMRKFQFLWILENLVKLSFDEKLTNFTKKFRAHQYKQIQNKSYTESKFNTEWTQKYMFWVRRGFYMRKIYKKNNFHLYLWTVEKEILRCEEWECISSGKGFLFLGNIK